MGDIQANEARAAREEEERREREKEEEEENDEESSIDNDELDDTESVQSVQSVEEESISKDTNYPMLCRVINKVPVVEFSTVKSSSDEKEAICQQYKRIIDSGSLVVCTEMRVWVWNKLNVENIDETVSGVSFPREVGAGVYLKVPDGWISQNELEKMLVLKHNS